jgi:hypothetical protein
MGFPQRKTSDSAFWKELYEAALFEFDREKLPERIALAEQAATQRRRELLASAGDGVEEQECLDDALYGLSALRRISESGCSTQHGNAEAYSDNRKTGT